VEQRLKTDYLSPCLIERAIAIVLIIVGIGVSVAIAAWGLRVAWVHPNIATKERPIASTRPQSVKTLPADTKISGQDKSSTSDIIRRQVTVFSKIKHLGGTVTTGWIYSDGASQVPTKQYCYYSAVNADLSSTRVDIASDRKPLLNVSTTHVPELEKALTKCQWWN